MVTHRTIRWNIRRSLWVFSLFGSPQFSNYSSQPFKCCPDNGLAGGMRNYCIFPGPTMGAGGGTSLGVSSGNWADLRRNGHSPGRCCCFPSVMCGTRDPLLLPVHNPHHSLKMQTQIERQRLGPCSSLPACSWDGTWSGT